jgi:hypothetical protein
MDPKLPKNLYPISLLSITGKLFEQVALQIFQRHTAERGLLNASQFGSCASQHNTLMQEPMNWKGSARQPPWSNQGIWMDGSRSGKSRSTAARDVSVPAKNRTEYKSRELRLRLCTRSQGARGNIMTNLSVKSQKGILIHILTLILQSVFYLSISSTDKRKQQCTKLSNKAHNAQGPAAQLVYCNFLLPT